MSTIDLPHSCDHLLMQSGRGDVSAFARLYDELAPTVFGLARFLASDYDAAVDISYRAFLALWQTAPTFDSGSVPAAIWVARETRRQALIRLNQRTLKSAPDMAD
jgi:RNA polymerase sigma-70 factor (ECF subfamily)